MKKGLSVGLVPTFYEALFADLAKHYPHYEGVTLDRDYLMRRFVAEGPKFVFITLPTLGKAIESSLVTGKAFVCPTGFSLTSRNIFPEFLSFFFEKLFEENGLPLYQNVTESEATALWSGKECYFQALRQITMAFSKVEGDIPSDGKVFKDFLERVQSVGLPNVFHIMLYGRYAYSVFNEARKLLKRRFPSRATLSSRFGFWNEYFRNPYGRHGPGAVAGGESGKQKWNFQYIPGIERNLYAWRDEDPFIGVCKDATSRVIAVPKDFRSPRVICIEPKEFQFAQQGLMEMLYRHIRHDYVLSRRICLEDTTPSRELCYKDNVATIDLKDASDYLSLELLKVLYPKWFVRLLTRYRSRALRIGDNTYRYRTAFTMGSAVCFPIETITFWAIAQAAMNLRGYPHDVLRVYGDDIICSKRNLGVIREALSCCGCEVNVNKTCAHPSPIRESCGEYTFNKKPCGIVRFRTATKSTYRDFISLFEYSKVFLTYGYEETANAILLCANEVFPVPYRALNIGAAYDCASYRYNRKLQRAEVRMPCLIQDRCSESLSGCQALYAWYVGAPLDPSFRGTRKRVKVKWVPFDAVRM